jgi:hypothetical protein
MRSGSPAPDGSGWPSAQRPQRDEAASGPGPYGPGPYDEPHEGPGGRREAPFGPEISWPNGFRRLDAESRRLLESGYGTGGYGPEGHGYGYGTGGYRTGGYGPEGPGPGGYLTAGYGAEGPGTGGYRTGGYGPEVPGTGGYRTGGYGPGDPGYGGSGAAGYGGGSGYRQPAVDDYGYGDPGYSDPGYDGPSAQGGSAWSGGNRGSRDPAGSPGRDDAGYGRSSWYHGRESRESSGPEFGYQQPLAGAPEVYPTTGAQEALPATGPQPTAESWTAQDPGFPPTASPAYPEQWYGNPRLEDPRLEDPRGGDPRFDGARPEDPRGGDPRFDGARPEVPRLDGPRGSGPPATDPRLEGMRYDELRYDEPSFAQPGYNELDDESWYRELRRSAPSYPQRPADQVGQDQRRADPPRRADPRAFAHGEQPGYGQQPGYPQAPAQERASGYGQARDDRGRPGPAMSADREADPAPWPGLAPGIGEPHPAGPAFPQDLTVQGAGYLGAPTAQIGVLTPPALRQLDDAAEDGQLLAPASAVQTVALPVRPGHGLDGPEITSSWPAQPHGDDLEAFDEFWREDDKDGGYPGLFPDDDADSGGPHDKGARGGRRTGRRRGRSSDHRLWLALVGVVLAAAAAIAGIIKFEFPSQSGPAHTMITPARIGTYLRTVDLERQTNVAQLRDEVIRMSSGQASDVVSAVYESGNSAAGSTEQIVMFIGGHLANAAPASSIAGFTQKFPGAAVVSPGSLGGQAACVEEGTGTSAPKSICVWFDNDSFGEIVSPTMNATSLASVMRTIRPSVEVVVKN